MKLIHGGDWAGYEREYGKTAIDFSANISPLGLPPKAAAAAAEALARADRYPDPLCRQLREELAAYHGTDGDRIVCGCGAADLIYRLCRTLRPTRSIIISPGFAEYERALRAEDCRIEHLYLAEENGFLMTGELAEKLPGEAKLLFLCSPNNPTGLLIEKELLHGILCRCRERGAVLALDECFLDFCDEAKKYSLVDELSEWPELVILRAFTKTWAMAGLRLGYALCGSKALAEKLQDCGQPWPVSGIAQAAGIAALHERAYLEQLRELISHERERMTKGLADCGIRVIKGKANYLLFESSDHGLCEKLRRHGVLIRDCADYPGLRPGWYRTAIRTAAENDLLLETLREVLNG